jgi:hypothetical protein
VLQDVDIKELACKIREKETEIFPGRRSRQRDAQNPKIQVLKNTAKNNQTGSAFKNSFHACSKSIDCRQI